jgi:hypothetical protein
MLPFITKLINALYIHMSITPTVLKQRKMRQTFYKKIKNRSIHLFADINTPFQALYYLTTISD